MCGCGLEDRDCAECSCSCHDSWASALLRALDETAALRGEDK